MPFLDYMVLKILFSKNVQWPMEILMSREIDTGKSPPYSRIPVSYNMCAGEKKKYRVETGHKWIAVIPGWWCILFLYPLLGSSLPSSSMYYCRNRLQREPEASRPGLRGLWASRGVPLCTPWGQSRPVPSLGVLTWGCPAGGCDQGACRDSCRDSAQNWPFPVFYFSFSFSEV